MHRKISREGTHNRAAVPFMTEEISAVLSIVKDECQDDLLENSIHFGPTCITFVKRLISGGGTIITDTDLLLGLIKPKFLGENGARLECFIDDQYVINMAETRHATRAEVAVDYALSLHGQKLFAIGSAPTAVSRLVQRRQTEPMSDVCVITALNGFASAVQLKEKLWDSDLASIVVRGKQGGVNATASIINAILKVVNG